MSDARTPAAGPPPADHTWVLSRLAPYWARLLDDVECERIESHLASCEPCRRAWEAQSAVSPTTPGSEVHVPAALIADWERQRRTLRGLERATIRYHLEGCDGCRRDLQALGHDPVLEFIDALEPAGLMPRVASERNASAPAEPRASALASTLEKLRRLNWALGGWAAAATAAVVLMTFVMLRQEAPAPQGSLPSPGLGSPGMTGATAGGFPTLESSSTAVLAAGEVGEGPGIQVPAGAPRHVIALQLKGLASSTSDSVTVVLQTDGRIVLRQSMPATPAADSSFTVVLRGAPVALPMGAYRIRVTVGSATERTYAFRIVRP